MNITEKYLSRICQRNTDKSQSLGSILNSHDGQDGGKPTLYSEAMSGEMLAEQTIEGAMETEEEPLTETEEENFEERLAIMQYDGGLPAEQAEDYAYFCVKSLPLIYAEPCGKETLPAGYCKSYSMKVYTPSMDLQPYCLREQKWCYKVKQSKGGQSNDQ